MSYTPINWQTGQTITAEKLNKMDNGWAVDRTQLFSETVTTELTEEEGISAELEYTTFINEDTLVITFDGVDYTCSNTSDSEYESRYGAQWSEALDNYDFSEYPFVFTSLNPPIPAIPGGNRLYTATAGTYTVSASNEQLNVSDDFKNAVRKAADSTVFLCVQGVSTEEEMTEAYNNGRLLYFQFDGTTYIVVGVANGSVGFMPTNPSMIAGFDNGVFSIGIS